MSTQYTVRQMIDLAVGTPDGGSINLSMLQAVLHVLAHAQRVSARPVQLRDLTVPRAPTTLVVTEKRVRGRQQSDVMKYIEREELAREKYLREIRQREDSKAEPAATPTPMCSPVSIHLSQSSVLSAPEYIIVAERVMTTQEAEKGAAKPDQDVAKRRSISLSDVSGQQSVSAKVIKLGKIAKDPTRHSEVPASLNKVIHIKKSQSEELTIEKSDILSTSGVNSADFDEIADVFEMFSKNEDDESAIAQLVTESTLSGILGNAGQTQRGHKSLLPNDWSKLKRALQQLDETLDTLNKSFLQIPPEIRDGGILMDVVQLREKLRAIGQADGTLKNLERRVNDLQTSVSHYTSQISGLDTAFNDQIIQVEDNITELKEEVEAISKTIGQGFSKLSPTQLAEMSELQEKVHTLQIEYDDTSGHVAKLLTSNKENERFIQLLLNQVEYLNVAKSDNEQLVDALVSKADRGSLNGMMTEEQFQSAYSALLRIVNEIHDGFEKQAAECRAMLAELRKEINNSATRDDLTSLDKSWIGRFKDLQYQLKHLMKLSEDIHASGTKQKYIRDVNCLSCDAAVVMGKQVDCLVPMLSYFPMKEHGARRHESNKKL